MMLFLGVSTGESFVQKVFPSWCETLGIEAELKGVNIPVDAPFSTYQEIVQKIKSEKDIRGALVTTHKTSLFEATHSMFDIIMDGARDLHEAGAIFKTQNSLVCEATDPFSVLLATKEILSRRKLEAWRDVLIIGGGGAGLALAYTLLRNADLAPQRLFVSDISESRISTAQRILGKLQTSCQVNVVLTKDGTCDRLVQNLNKCALIVNATGMGKDRPGSPISMDCFIPYGSTMWDFNYRGERLFLNCARKQEIRQSLIVEDGWYYFICGWLQVMSRIFAVPISDELSDAFVSVAVAKR